jgi:hypothetical protein
MQFVLGFAVALLALAAVRQLRSARRGWMRHVLGRALPGACTGVAETAATRPAPRDEPAVHLRWIEVVNLTAADHATPPGARARDRASAEDVPVGSR